MLETEIWLSALDNDPGAAEARLYWNVKDDSTLLGLAPDPGRDLWLGVTRPPLPEARQMPGAAGRIAAVLFRRGTIAGYSFPRVDPDLISEVLGAARAIAADDGPQVDEVALAEYLRERPGHFLLSIERPRA